MTHYVIEHMVNAIDESMGGPLEFSCGYRMRCAPGVWLVEGAFTPRPEDTCEYTTRFVDAHEYLDRIERIRWRAERARRKLWETDA